MPDVAGKGFGPGGPRIEHVDDWLQGVGARLVYWGVDEVRLVVVVVLLLLLLMKWVPLKYQNSKVFILIFFIC